MWDKIANPVPNFNGYTVISAHTSLSMWLHIYAGVKVKPCWWNGPLVYKSYTKIYGARKTYVSNFAVSKVLMEQNF